MVYKNDSQVSVDVTNGMPVILDFEDANINNAGRTEDILRPVENNNNLLQFIDSWKSNYSTLSNQQHPKTIDKFIQKIKAIDFSSDKDNYYNQVINIIINNDPLEVIKDLPSRKEEEMRDLTNGYEWANIILNPPESIFIEYP
jgi:hypothetical protein